MRAKYSEKEVLNDLSEAKHDMRNLYNAKCINWKGKAKEGEYCSEVIAKIFKGDEIKKLTQIQQIRREKSYNPNHDGKTERETNRQEEIFAKKLYLAKREFTNLGEIIEYQIPLKNKRKDKAGKIDLISYSKNHGKVYIIELKFGNNNETLLRAALEIATYYQILDKDKFLEDFRLRGVATDDIKKAVLLCEGSNSFNEAEELDERPKLKKLIKEMGVEVFLMQFQYELKKISL